MPPLVMQVRLFVNVFGKWLPRASFIYKKQKILEVNTMKQNYTAPTAEKISFRFEDQIATSAGACGSYWTNIGDSTCQDVEFVKNFAD